MKKYLNSKLLLFAGLAMVADAMNNEHIPAKRSIIYKKNKLTRKQIKARKKAKAARKHNKKCNH